MGKLPHVHTHSKSLRVAIASPGAGPFWAHALPLTPALGSPVGPFLAMRSGAGVSTGRIGWRFLSYLSKAVCGSAQGASVLLGFTAFQGQQRASNLMAILKPSSSVIVVAFRRCSESKSISTSIQDPPKSQFRPCRNILLIVQRMRRGHPACVWDIKSKHQNPTRSLKWRDFRTNSGRRKTISSMVLSQACTSGRLARKTVRLRLSS